MGLVAETIGGQATPRFVLACAVAFGSALYSALVPPIQSPDETEHLKRAYLVSKGRLFLETPPGQSYGGWVDDGLMAYIGAYLHPLIEGKQALSASIRGEARKIRWSGVEHFEIMAPGYYFPAIWLPHAAGLAIGRALSFTVETAYGLVRFLCLIISVLFLWLAVRLWPMSQAAAALLLLPMSLFQFVSPTIDGLTSALAVWWISTWLRAMERSYPVSLLEQLALAAGAFVLATCRLHLAPLLGLLVVLAVVRRNRVAGVGAAVLSVAVMAWYGYALTATKDLRVVRGVTSGEVVAHYVAHPDALVEVLGATVAHRGLREFYGFSFIGVLGWLDTQLESWVYLVTGWTLAVLLGLSFSWRDFRSTLRPRLFLLASAVVSVLIIFLSLLATWTRHPAVLVEGVQGRYFLLPALLAAYALGRGPGTDRTPFVALGRVILIGWLFVVTGSVAQTLLSRFHESPPASSIGLRESRALRRTRTPG